jgi:hypothetical protein
MHQSVIVELPELMGLVNESPEKVKAFLAKPFDHIRALFARKAVKNLRGFVFVGTTNSDKYLSAAMGVRRFWPVRIPRSVKAIKMSQIKADRDQLFAEAIHMFRDGYQYWNMPSEHLVALVEDRVIDEPLIQPIKEMLPILGEQWTSTDVYRRLEGLGYITKGLSSAVVQRIDSSLAKLGCISRRDSSQRIVFWQASTGGSRLDDLI